MMIPNVLIDGKPWRLEAFIQVLTNKHTHELYKTDHNLDPITKHCFRNLWLRACERQLQPMLGNEHIQHSFKRYGLPIPIYMYRHREEIRRNLKTRFSDSKIELDKRYKISETICNVLDIQAPKPKKLKYHNSSDIRNYERLLTSPKLADQIEWAAINRGLTIHRLDNLSILHDPDVTFIEHMEQYLGSGNIEHLEYAIQVKGPYLLSNKQLKDAVKQILEERVTPEHPPLLQLTSAIISTNAKQPIGRTELINLCHTFGLSNPRLQLIDKTSTSKRLLDIASYMSEKNIQLDTVISNPEVTNSKTVISDDLELADLSIKTKHIHRIKLEDK